MSQQSEFKLDDFLNQFKDSESFGSSKSVCGTGKEPDNAKSAQSPGGHDCEGPKPAGNCRNESPASDEQEKQSGFCALLWSGIGDEIMKAYAEAGYPDEDEETKAEDAALRQKIIQQLANPHVNFRDFSRLVYRWRDLHLSKTIPKKDSVDVPSWKTD